VVNQAIGTNATISLDGSTPNRTIQQPVKNDNLTTYAFTFYEATNLNNSNHTLSIVFNAYGNGNRSGFYAFDYADVDGTQTSDSGSTSTQVLFTSLGNLYLTDHLDAVATLGVSLSASSSVS
jgi:hypothetical protein